jgi:hypothetical protein
MSLEHKLNQVCTYWEPSGGSDLYGKPLWNTPVELKCRWENNQTQIMAKTGQEVVSKARVYLAQPVSVDGYLFLGTSEETDPTTVVGAESIQNVGTTPDLRNLKQLTTVYL